MTLPELSRAYQKFRGIDWEDWDYDNAHLSICEYIPDTLILRLPKETLFVNLTTHEIISDAEEEDVQNPSS